MAIACSLSVLDPHTAHLENMDEDIGHREDVPWNEAHGFRFLCPKCFLANNGSDIGVHSVICWRPCVSQIQTPRPGRWEMIGTGFHDLTLVAGSSSVLLTSGCQAHFFIRNGNVEDLT